MQELCGRANIRRISLDALVLMTKCLSQEREYLQAVADDIDNSNVKYAVPLYSIL